MPARRTMTELMIEIVRIREELEDAVPHKSERVDGKDDHFGIASDALDTAVKELSKMMLYILLECGADPNDPQGRRLVDRGDAIKAEPMPVPAKVPVRLPTLRELIDQAARVNETIPLITRRLEDDDNKDPASMACTHFTRGIQQLMVLLTHNLIECGRDTDGKPLVDIELDKDGKIIQPAAAPRITG